jgi:hypothetical protein
VAATLVRGRERPPDLNTPSGVVLAYALAEQRGDGQTAWDLLATSAQARGDRDRFIAAATNSGNSGSEYLTTEDERLDGDNAASVLLVRTYPASSGLLGSSSGYSSRNTVRLVREGQAWRITVPPDDFRLVNSKR